MELIPSNTTHLANFPFLPILNVSNGMEHINNIITILFLFFLFLNSNNFVIFFLLLLSFSINGMVRIQLHQQNCCWIHCLSIQ